MEHFGRVGLTLSPSEALASVPYGYRRRARLGVNVDREGRRLLGYRRHRSERLCDIEVCPVLTPALEQLLQPIRCVIEQLEAPRLVGHIELLEADSGVCAIVRQIRPVPEDEALWRKFGEQHTASVVFARRKDDPAVAEGVALSYTLNAAGQTLTLEFRPGDFFQINRDVNRQLVSTLLEWLSPGPGTRVLDLFAGVGNFSLGLAAMGARVHAVEGQKMMVQRLQRNAQRNRLDGVTAAAADLTQAAIEGHYDIIVLDPPRDGAHAVCEQLALQSARTVAYVSCNPATLARDAAVLVNGGYRIAHAAIVDMFSQTAHLEALVIFKRG